LNSQIFLKAHNERNLAAYQGRVDIDEKLLTDLIAATKRLSAAVAKLSPPAAFRWPDQVGPSWSTMARSEFFVTQD
jgi:hypothetical protein